MEQVASNTKLSFDAKFNQLMAPDMSDQERAWVLYRWVTKHFRHDSRLASRIGDPKKHSLNDLYKFAGGSCAVYADVLQRLMQKAGLEAKTIYGVAKGGAPSARINGKPVNHVWNAVKLDGRWYVVDATWGAGYVDQYGFQKEQNDLFFKMNAELAVLSHFDADDELGYQKQFGLTPKLFSRIPEDAIYAASLGFDAKSILNLYSTRGDQRLVRVFDQAPGSFRVLKAPVQGRVGKSTQQFSIESSAYEELMLVQGKTWNPLRKQGKVHSLSITPVKGELILMGRRPNQHEFEALLAYDVN